ncbi:MAG: hypothetical protein K9I69_00255 [Ignavibacteriales bacterium]|nr:hypothetical protein [Ignavibacteriales bacterium]MCF8317008.1 hypothetical protein [Ignavibacteriales bacterium]MCF8438606.1 hypothetical protein [Ignavibacteriales bacterium]
MILENIISYIVLPLLGLSLFFVFVRILIGPSIEDRIIALDVLTSIGIAFLGVYSVQSNNPLFLDIGIILGIISFLSTVAFSHYLERKSKKC